MVQESKKVFDQFINFDDYGTLLKTTLLFHINKRMDVMIGMLCRMSTSEPSVHIIISIVGVGSVKQKEWNRKLRDQAGEFFFKPSPNQRRENEIRYGSE